MARKIGRARREKQERIRQRDAGNSQEGLAAGATMRTDDDVHSSHEMRYAADILRVRAVAELTSKQLAALEAILLAESRGAHPPSVWQFGSTTINRLRRYGLIETPGGDCKPTQLARDMYGGEGPFGG